MPSKYIMILGAALVLTACKTTPEPEPPIVVEVPEPIQTCMPISALEKVIIPEETETYIAITSIENPPYDPIERKETLTRVVKEAQVTYVDSEGREVIDICSEDPATEEIVPATEG